MTDSMFPWLAIALGCLGVAHGITHSDHLGFIGGVALVLFGAHEVLFVD